MMKTIDRTNKAPHHELEWVFTNYSRYFDAVVGDGLYFKAPFINFCTEHHKDVVVVLKGDQRLLLQDAEGLFTQRAPNGQWTERRRTVQYWDEENFTSAEGVSKPLRVLHTLETEHCRERIAGQWKERDKTSSWYWATTFSKKRLPARDYWHAGHWRWDIENGCFNTTSTHWGLDHVFKHEPTAIVGNGTALTAGEGDRDRRGGLQGGEGRLSRLP